MTMTALHDFLQARILEDEAAARLVTDEVWDLNEWSTVECADLGARYLPSRLWWEAATKQMILDYGDHTSHKALARIYRDHPDYKEAWNQV